MERTLNEITKSLNEMTSRFVDIQKSIGAIKAHIEKRDELIEKAFYFRDWHGRFAPKYAPDGVSGSSDKKIAPPLSTTRNRETNQHGAINLINDSNKPLISFSLSQVAENVKGNLQQPKEFLDNLINAFGNKYSYQEINGKYYKLRLSDHLANNRRRNSGKTEMTSIVIQMSNSRSRKGGDEIIREFVYKPENLTQKVQCGIVEGLKGWIQNGIYSDDNADSIKKSIWRNI